MQYTELILTVPASALDAAAEIALMAAPGGMYIEDYRNLVEDTQKIAHSDLIDAALLAQDRTTGRIHLYLPPQDPPAEAAAFLAERLAALGVRCGVETLVCRSEDWEHNWKAYFHPLPVGKRLLIQPAWEAPDPAASPDRVKLLLEPGAAFGSGSHATTRLCLEALEEALEQFPTRSAAVAPQAAGVLDIGCGSGILAVAALLLGAVRAVGVDIDPLAVASARENGERNGFRWPVLHILEGSLAAQVDGQFDVIVSNIVADAIIALAPEAGRCLAPGGVWVSSGIVDVREADVLEALQKSGWQVVGRREEGGWVCLTAQG
ncbi:MAG: 50S ribosomal protein L11 methyltransferase [Oscillospiraceae bacterium]|jgi:ribosomal protein L11 methyltransferase|nr:50S ribosomal protein L11 methyltransferase [Oscillospiraceae bacterium]